MYSDRELLELAAKAAGYAVEPDAHIPSGGIWLAESDGDKPWNPLTDDGDAMRLAVETGLVVCVMRNAGFTGVYLPACSIGGKYDEVQLHADDANGATRRAIVRAAAAIGEAMQ